FRFSNTEDGSRLPTDTPNTLMSTTPNTNANTPDTPEDHANGALVTVETPEHSDTGASNGERPKYFGFPGTPGVGKKGRSGPPRGNRNGMRHGLAAGQLPADAKYIEYRLNDFRVRLEDAVMEARGEVTIMDAACINTCLKWERHSALALRWLVKAG